MSEENWTPGPWSVNGLKALLRYGRKCDGRWTEEIKDDEYLPDEKCVNLIAAAPCLYAALATVEWVVASKDDPRRFCPCCNRFEAVGHTPRCTLNAALKKARGES